MAPNVYRKRRFMRKPKAGKGLIKRVKKIERAVRVNKDIRYTDKTLMTGSGITTTGNIVYSIPVPTRGDNFRAQRAGDIISVFKQEYFVTCVGAEDTTFFTTDFWNNLGIKIGYVVNNNSSASLPTVSGSAGALWDTGVIGAVDVIPLLPEGPSMAQKCVIQRRKLVQLSGLSQATAGTAGQTFVKDHHKSFKIVINYKKPMVVKFTSSDSDTLSTFLGKCPFFAVISDSSLTPNPECTVACRTWYYA